MYIDVWVSENKKQDSGERTSMVDDIELFNLAGGFARHKIPKQ